MNTTVGAGFTSANVVNFGEQTFPNGKSLSWTDYWYRIVVEEDLPIVEYLMQVCRRTMYMVNHEIIWQIKTRFI